jgi:hypothetical protein
MYDVIKSKIPQDRDYPDRYYPLMLYKRILDGTLYEDAFEYGYHQEYIGDDFHPRYIVEAERAPCINTGLNLMRSVVEQSVSFLYGEDRFPRIMVSDVPTKEWLDSVILDTHLVHIMQDAVTKGSIGSVAIHLKVLQDRFFPVVMETIFLTPTFDPEQPDTLLKVVERRKVRGSDLALAGYAIDEADFGKWYWFHRQWDNYDETAYVPYQVGSEQEDKFRLRRDDKRSVRHGLSLVPFVWIRNLVGTDNDIDGRCTFEPAIENCIQIDYNMSRADRALKYNADPLLMVKTRKPTEMQGFIRKSENALVLDPQGDAKILEVSGDAAHAILDTIEELKDEAMQSMHGSRADPDKLATSNSSVAQRLLYLPMVQLASHLRISYCESGLVDLLKMMMVIACQIPIKVLGKYGAQPDADQVIHLAFNDFFPPTPFDQQLIAQTVVSLTEAGILSKRSALANLSKYFDFEDLDEEIAQIAKEQDESQAREIAVQAAVAKAKPSPNQK